MLQPEPFEVVPPTERSKNWPSLIASAIIHAVIILLLLFGIPQSDSRSRRLPNTGETLQPIALPELPPTPKSQPKPIPKPQPPPPPPPPLKEQVLAPDANKDVPIPKEAAPAKPIATPPPPAQPPADQPKVQPESPVVPPNMLRIPKPGDYPESKAFLPLAPSTGTAQKFTPPTSPANAPIADVNEMGRLGMGSHDPRNWENSFDDVTEGKCVKMPDLGTNPDGTPALASINGTVYEADNRTPVPYATLVIIGNGAIATADAKGQYRLEFDPKLLQNCRMQQVLITAAGHVPKYAYLAIGEQKNSDVQLQRHH